MSVRDTQQDEDNKYWKLVRGYLNVNKPAEPDYIDFETFLAEISPLVKEHISVSPDRRILVAKRLSCLFSTEAERHRILQSSQNKIKLFDYNGVTWHPWSESRVIEQIRTQLKGDFGIEFDYFLVHLYRDGDDLIGVHRDREAMNTPIVSLSLGATRKFRIRDQNKTSGWDFEFSLESGTALLMKIGMQNRYVHFVPQERKVDKPRINITARMFE